MSKTRQNLVAFHMAVGLTGTIMQYPGRWPNDFETCTWMLTFKSVGLRHTEKATTSAPFARVWVSVFLSLPGNCHHRHGVTRHPRPLSLDIVARSRQTAVEIQVLLHQVILRSEKAHEDAARHSRVDVKEPTAPAVAAPSGAGAETASAAINRGTDNSTSRRETREGTCVHRPSEWMVLIVLRNRRIVSRLYRAFVRLASPTGQGWHQGGIAVSTSSRIHAEDMEGTFSRLSDVGLVNHLSVAKSAWGLPS